MIGNQQYVFENALERVVKALQNRLIPHQKKGLVLATHAPIQATRQDNAGTRISHDPLQPPEMTRDAVIKHCDIT
jgi:hypothetical protein